MLERIKVFLCLELPQTRKAILVKLNAAVGSGHCFLGGGGGGGGEGRGVDLNFERELNISKKIECGRNIEAMARTKGTICSGLVSQSKYGNPQVRALARAGLALARAGLASLAANLAIASLVPFALLSGTT